MFRYNTMQLILILFLQKIPTCIHMKKLIDNKFRQTQEVNYTQTDSFKYYLCIT